MGVINVFTVSGNLTRDVELKYTSTGKAVAKGSIANNSGFGEYAKTNFINFTLWGKAAEGLAQHLTKGKQLFLTGAFETNNWVDNDGIQHKDWQMNQVSLQFGRDPRGSTGPAPETTGQSGQTGPGEGMNAHGMSEEQIKREATNAQGDDDIPF